MFQSFSDAISKFATFSGRARRKEFWGFLLVSMLISAAAGALYGENGVLAGALEVLLFIPTLAVAARRLHDQGRSAGWLLIALTGIGIPILFFMMMVEGQPTGNQYGPDPKAEERLDSDQDEWYHRDMPPRQLDIDRPRREPVYREDQLV